MTVVDASILAKLVLKEYGWRRVYELLLSEVVLLDHAVKEVANAI